MFIVQNTVSVHRPITEWLIKTIKQVIKSLNDWLNK